ncbi:MAG: alpha/beta hydrolase [Actinomycetota bacterium]|nr:alpha/beta hydrolase [Actinomycetota bacterium]
MIPSFDGTLICGRRVAGPPGSEPILLSNAIGANLTIWKDVLPLLAAHHPVITWDHRGLFESHPPASRALDAASHATDALSVLDAFGVKRACLLSWSSGTRIAIEIAAHHPERISSLAVVCGGYGHAPGNLIRYVEPASALPAVARAGKYFPTALGALFKNLVGRPEITGILRQTGLVGTTADISALVDGLRAMAGCDLGLLLRSYEEVAGDAAPGLAAMIEAPTLLIAGERDRFTSLRMMEDMATRMADARLEIYEKGTHYIPIEYPARLADHLTTFFAR